MNFIPGTCLNHPKDSAVYWFLFHDHQVLMDISPDTSSVSNAGSVSDTSGIPGNPSEVGYHLPLAVGEIFALTSTERYLGTLEGHPCYFATVAANQDFPATYSFIRVRDLYGKMPEDLFWLVGRAFHLSNWDRHTLYCGSCGAPTEPAAEERAKICPRCRELIFPRISPAIIVAITKGNQILLARNRNLPGDLHTVIAGFVEPGESLEECLRREVREEVGIEVKNIQYFASQPWPFPDSLMVAFVAEYESGDIEVDGREIIEANWFTAGNLPPIPGRISVARKLIDWFTARYRE